MSESSFIGLIHNTALLLSLALAYEILPARLGFRPAIRQALTGLAAGTVGIAIMLTPWVLVPGIVFDTRSILLCVTGLFYGSLSTGIAAAMTVAYRLYLGGSGAWTGVVVILATAGIGLAWRHARKARIESIGWRELYLFGLTAHIAMLALMLSLPGGAAAQVLPAIGPPVLVVYPIGTVLLGILLRNRFRGERTVEALSASEERFSLSMEATHDGIWDLDVRSGSTYYSPAYWEMLGYLPGENISMKGRDWVESIHPEDRGAAVAVNEECIEGRRDSLKITFRMRSKDGDWRWIESRGKAVSRDGNGRALRLIGTHVDITERKEAEERLADSLREKETLLRELYHRTKNNMQVITSLLELESDESRSEETRSVLREMGNRIASMALVHKMLYKAQDLSRVRLDEYVRQLAALLLASYGTEPGTASLRLELEPATVLIDVAMPCGLVLNELLSNALKHAFPDGRRGEILVRIRAAVDGATELEVADDGIGLPEGFDVRNQPTLGLRTIFGLVEHQLQGKATFSSGPGLSCAIRIPGGVYGERI